MSAPPSASPSAPPTPRPSPQPTVTSPLSTTAGAPVPVIDRAGPLLDRYAAIVFDLWGVVHDGVRMFPGIPEVFRALNDRGIPFVLLSNAPRRLDSVVAKLDVCGVDRGLYRHVMSSGEATYEALRTRDDPFHAGLGQRLFHLGPTRDDDVYAGLPYTRVDRPEDADFVLATGPHDFDDTLEQYVPALQVGLDRGIPLICANPDLVVMVGDTRAICAGMFAQWYEARGGRVVYHGKPHAGVYRRALALIGDPDPAQVLAIGDSFRTDVAGAAALGADALLVAAGIHKAEVSDAAGRVDGTRVAAAAAEAGVRPPVAAIDELRW